MEHVIIGSNYVIIVIAANAISCDISFSLVTVLC